MKTIGIVGARRRDAKKDFDLVEKAFLGVWMKGDIICSGLCSKGGNRFAVAISKLYNVRAIWFPAKWEKFGRSAGFIRNMDIAKNSDILITCVAIDRKGGT